jgi:pimeloyl-ACP methyl ester carboxylesterase
MHFESSPLDRPEVLRVLFHPRRDPFVAGSAGDSAVHDVLIPVEESVQLGARFHVHNPSFTNLLFFHGNGEIVADYDDMGPVYQRIGVNFYPVDYRGYGRSSGEPSCTALLRDAQIVMDYWSSWLQEKGCTGPLVVMGRSLGSAPAIELASIDRYPISGLIIESGFAYTLPLLRLLGLDVERLGVSETEAVGNHLKMSRIRQPTLIIHAEFDRIIPFSDAQRLYELSAAKEKWLVKIPDAGHNDIFYQGLAQYMSAVKSFVERLGPSRK